MASSWSMRICSSSYRDLDFGKPLALTFFIPNAVYIFLPYRACDLIAIFFNILQNDLIALRKVGI